MSTRSAARARGFTLLELLVAVAILAIAMGALRSGFARYAAQAAHLRERSIATWVAHNQMTEVELAPPWPATGGRNGEVEMAGAKWRWRLDVKSTDDPDLRRLDMTVYPPGSEDESPDAPTSARLSGFLSKEGR